MQPEWLHKRKIWNRRLSWELQLLVVLPCQEVIVEKVYVEPCLQHSADPHNPLPVVWLRHEAVYPVQDIQPPVRPAAPKFH